MLVELLAPAGNIQIARSAILSGADAIYIGPPAFGARKAVGNSMDDIGRLLDFAHLFGVRVYLTMNTILFDDELDEAETIARRAEEIGVDALIVQDMAYQMMNLHRIPLHASTQTFNFDLDRIRLVASAGFDRIVLERSLSLSEIRQIRSEIPIEIETFIHGAMCVGFSGRCYLSQYLSGRSGNRGVCAQACRNDYSLIEEDGKCIKSASPLLSVSDIDFSDRILQLIDAGVTSFKIEGRLKDESYVVNNVSYYNSILQKLGVERTSNGRSICRFDPNPRKSFSRGTSGHMFLDNTRAKVGAPTRSIGESVAKVLKLDGNRVSVSGLKVEIHNGDGICWQGGGGYVNGVQGNILLMSSIIGLSSGDVLYRNLDNNFSPSSKDVDRTIPVDIFIQKEGAALSISSSGYEETFTVDSTPARNEAVAKNNIVQAFTKSGDSCFAIGKVNLKLDEVPFIPQSRLNGIRREFLAHLESFLLSQYIVPSRQNFPSANILFPEALSYEWNVSNQKAVSFYKEHGVKEIEPALELQEDITGKAVMITRHCIRRQIGICPKDNPQIKIAKPLILENNGRKLQAVFDCAKCQMRLLVHN